MKQQVSNPSPTQKVLLVDDDRRILSALKRQLYRHFDLSTAESGADALALIQQNGPFAVIVTDMRMPEMNGVELLSRVCEVAPLSTRIMLTGNSDQETAVKAVNEGQVFRFHTKPCDTKELAQSIKQGIEAYREQCASQEEQHRLEQTLVNTENQVNELHIKAEAADRARMRFLATMNHELRTPLNHVIGFAEALKLDVSDELSPDKAAYLDHITDSGHALLETINRILTASRLTAKTRLDRQHIGACAIVDSVVRDAQAQASANDITVSVREPMERTTIFADRSLIQRAVEELVSNAVRFNRTGGEVVVTINGESGHDVLLIRVRDTGSGMSAEDIQKALQPFSQIDDDLNRQFEGVGLGLTLAQAVANAHGGQLLIESEPGRGTIASLRIPRAGTNGKSADISAA